MSVSPRFLASLARWPAGLLVLVVLALPAVASARPWHRSYAAGQQQLVDGRAAEAEASLVGAIADRPQAGCRLRTYGVKVRDYTPWYYLGVALADQGRNDEAVDAFERSLAEGVVADCPGTQLQALDLLDRLDRLAGPGEPAHGGSGQVGDLRTAALEAGAEEWAAEEVAHARAVELDCGDCPAAAAAWLEALSRARVDGPILALLEQSAREAWLAAQLASRRAGSPGERFDAELARVASALEAARAPGDWLEAEAAAERVLAELPPGATVSRVKLPIMFSPAAMATARAIQRAERVAPRDASSAGLMVAMADLTRARELHLSGREHELELALELAERARAVFVLESNARVEHSEPGEPRARIELTWSARASVAKSAVLPDGEGP